MTPELEILVLRFIGSASGAVLAFLVVWPSGWADFLRRLLASMIFGVIAGPVLRSYMGLEASSENRMAASMMAGFIAWTVLPVILRVAGGIDWERLAKWFKRG